jgi:hypothetical protein
MICGPNYPVGPVLNLFLMLSRSTALKAVGLSVDDKPRSAGHFPAFSTLHPLTKHRDTLPLIKKG